MVESNPPTEVDVQSHYERNLSYPPFRECGARSLSLWTTSKAALRLRSGYKRFEGMRIAAVCPRREWGLLARGKRSKRRSSEHASLWLYESADRAEVVASFHVCEGSRDA